MIRDKGPVAPVAQADNDNQMLAMWLHGRPSTTQRAYAYEVQGVLAAIGKPLAHITLGGPAELFLWSGNSGPRFPGLRHQRGQVPFDSQEDGYLSSIPRPHPLSKDQEHPCRKFCPVGVHRLLALEPHPRNRVLLRLMYAARLQVGESAG
jgi:integrase/recombinase XerD